MLCSALKGKIPENFSYYKSRDDSHGHTTASFLTAPCLCFSRERENSQESQPSPSAVGAWRASGPLGGSRPGGRPRGVRSLCLGQGGLGGWPGLGAAEQSLPRTPRRVCRASSLPVTQPLACRTRSPRGRHCLWSHPLNAEPSTGDPRADTQGVAGTDGPCRPASSPRAPSHRATVRGWGLHRLQARGSRWGHVSGQLRGR